MSFESQDVDAGEDERKRDSSRKRDGKKDKRDKGYQMFEEEDSEEEQLVLSEDIKSPSKAKKEKLKPTFKFPVSVRKEKGKEKEEKKDKEMKQEGKEKKKEEKKKHKKDKKKMKHDPSTVIEEPSLTENPIFGVPLATAVERNKSHDGIELPAIVRECIDYIEECGLACEGIYRISGVKSKVQHLKDCYNRQLSVKLYEHEPNIVASLLKQFLRDLPEPVLTTALMPKFEEASIVKSEKKKVEAFTKLIADLPTCNRLLLSWMIVHMTHVINLAKENKMTLQNVSIVLSPTMQISHRVLNVLFSNVQSLFGDVLLRKYVPPLKPAHSKWTLELPDNTSALEEELAKQESLLNQLHADLNSGREDPVIEEQLWEVQRVVTQLKRKIKMANKSSEMGERWRGDGKRSSTASIPSLSAPEELKLDLRPAPEASGATTTVIAVVEKPPKDQDDVETSPEAATTSKEPKKGVKFAESSKKTKAPDVAEAKKKKDKVPAEVKKEEQQDKEKDKEQEKTVVAEAEIASVETKENVSEVKNETVTEDEDKKEKETAETEVKKEAGDAVKEVTLPDKDKEKTEEADEEVKESASEVEKDAQGDKVEEAETKEKPKEVARQSSLEPSPVIKAVEVAPQTLPTEEVLQKSEEGAATQPDGTKEAPKPEETPSKPMEPTSTKEVRLEKPESKPKPTKTEYVYRKAPNPPFVSTSLLQPMKAEIPKPKPVVEDSEAVKENIRKSEELRELEEELLGEKKTKEDKTEEDIPDDVDIDQLLEEEYALKMEEEELRAIEDELRQKIATERSEMERLTQEIQELQYLRQDSDLEDLSSSSMSSDESEDEEDLQELLSQLIQENEELEMNNADLCQKIHEERMICLSVKLQIRLLQQKQLESSYG